LQIEIKNMKITRSEQTERKMGKKEIFPPVICSSKDDYNQVYHINFILPGVKKENISFRLNEKKMYIEGESEHFMYLGGFDFLKPIDPMKTSFHFRDGEIEIQAPYENKFRD